MSVIGRLSVIDPSGKRQEVNLEKLPMTMGRFGDNDLLLRDNRISRRHAQILVEDGHLMLLDLESRHGTYVNGQRITRHRLAPNDRIAFGVSDSYVLIFSSDQPSVSKLLDRFKTTPTGTGDVTELQSLSAMLEVSRVLHAGLSLEDILTAVVDSSLTVAAAERGFLMLKDSAGKMSFKVARDRSKTSLPPEALKLSKTVVERALSTRRPVIHTDVGSGHEEALLAQRSIADLELRTIICLPLLKMQVSMAVETTVFSSQSDVIGVLYMDSRQPTSSFSDTSREILQSLCMQASEVVENAKLLEQARENEKLQRELDIARTIQQELLPRKFPQVGCYQVTGHNVACQEVGGDYFDVIDVGEGRLGIVIADVSGKGITAALLASMLQGVFYATANTGLSPEKVTQRVNAYVCDRSTPDKYATLFYCLLEADGRLVFVNAGHNPPYLVQPNGDIQPLSSDCLPIGMFPFAQYKENTVTLEPGATLVMYTDGVTEAYNPADEMFGEERLCEVLSQPLGTPEQVRDRVVFEVRNFAAGRAQNDDITVVVVRRD